MTDFQEQCELVSVLIPSNNTTYIAETLESVLSQTYTPLDILVVLNGPAIDEISKLESTYKDNVRFLTCAENGIVPSLNLGIANCKGRLIARIDADDLMPSQRIENQVNFLNENPLVVCVGGQLEYISSDLNLGKHPGYPLDDKKIKHDLHRFSAIPHPGMMYRKEQVEEIGGYSVLFPLIEDWDLLVRLAKLHKLANLETSVVKYRVHSTQSTVRNSKTQEESIKNFVESRLRNDIRNLLVKKDEHQRLLKVRRSLAGFFYLLASANSSGIHQKVKKTIMLILVTFVDPRIGLDYFSKKLSFLKTFF